MMVCDKSEFASVEMKHANGFPLEITFAKMMKVCLLSHDQVVTFLT